jgi:predicted GNAT superfamily acetyltransferase
MNATAYEIRLVDTPEEMARVEVLQRAVWPGSDIEIVPAHLLLTVAHNGGMVAAAFDGGACVGVVWGFLGQDARTGQIKHCSHQLGVHPDYRNTGLGFALKRFQWRWVREHGVGLITWTYDPLLARNAQLNIGRLGAVCNTYRRDEYGPLRDALNAGLPTDRFQVDWWLSSERVMARMEDAPRPDETLAAHLAQGARRSSGDRVIDPLRDETHPDAAAVLVAIPADFLALKAADPGLALAWRLGVRRAFEALFAQGYTVTGFIREDNCALYLVTSAEKRVTSNE